MTPDTQTFTVAWIAALFHERAAGEAMFDEEFDEPPADFVKSGGDPNEYSWGRIGKHHVVVASLPAGEPGLAPAATVAQALLSALPNIRIGLLVGIGAGIPGEIIDDQGVPNLRRDIRLGDVVVSEPSGTSGGVVQLDRVKSCEHNGQPNLVRTGFLNSPPTALRNALSVMRSKHLRKGSNVPKFIKKAMEEYPKMVEKFTHPGFKRSMAQQDIYSFRDGQSLTRDCREEPVFHYGVIGSGNTLEKSSSHRDQLLAQLLEEGIDPLCLEMEAAGLMNNFPCLVFRGISDYADVHKNDEWQEYAAITAAALAKDFLDYISPAVVHATAPLKEIFQTLRHVQENISGISIQTSKTNALLEQRYLSDQQQKISTWLNAPDPSINLDNARSLCLQNSGQWFLQGAPFALWKTGPQSALWLCGIPGCGKTILSSSIIATLEADEQPSNAEARSALAYFFFSFTDVDKQTSEQCLRSLIGQLSSAASSGLEDLEELYERNGKGGKQPTAKDLESTLMTLLRRFQRVRIVLDALDERRLGDPLFEWLVRLLNTDLVNVIVTSRPEHDIQQALRKYFPEEAVIPLQSDVVNNDIRSYIRHRLLTDPDFQRWRNMLRVQDEIEKKLMEKVDGMFRLAQCQLDELAKCIDKPMLDNTLAKLPQNLNRIYDRILSHIPPLYEEVAIQLLQYLALSERPLQLDEAIDAVAIRLEPQPSFDIDHRMPQPSDIGMLCSSLVTVRVHETGNEDLEKAKIWPEQSPKLSGSIQLAHFSVKQYLLSQNILSRHKTSFEPHVANAAVAKASLAYLSKVELRQELTETIQRFPLAHFSARFWAGGYLAAVNSDDVLNDMALSMMTERGSARSVWLHLFDPVDPHRREPWQLPFTTMQRVKRHSLVFAVALGMKSIVHHLLENMADVNVNEDSCIELAVRENHVEILEMLIERGADMAAYKNRKVLRDASSRGHVNIVKLLLSRGAEVNARGEGDDGRLFECRKYKGVMRDPVYTRGMEVVPEEVYWGTALQAASYKGHIEIVMLLLQENANVNLHAGVHGTALQAACDGGHKDVVQLLLDHQADVNQVGGEHGAALHAACVGGHSDIVQLLLNHQADVNVHVDGDMHGTALQAASAEGHSNIVKLLLNRQADVNIQAARYGSAIRAAAAMGHGEIVQLLLEKGATDKIIGNFFRSSKEVHLQDNCILVAECRDRHGGAKRSELDLNICLANFSGNFSWKKDGNFAADAQNIRLTADGEYLEADLRDEDNLWVYAKVWLNQRIMNNNGRLQVLYF